MSSGTLRHWVLRNTRDASRAAALASPRRTSASSSVTLASGASLMSRSGVTPLQIRYFHPTHKLYVSTEAVVATCLGLAGGATLLKRFLLKHASIGVVIPGSERELELVPPMSWAMAGGIESMADVKTIVTAGFEMASKKPIRLRDQAYREASFQVPYEVARLNPDAPQFTVEEMPPLDTLRKTWKEGARPGVNVKPPFDMEKDARVFLYTPNNSPKATAVFLAINAEYRSLAKQRTTAIDGQNRLWQAARSIWQCQHMHWVLHRRDIIERLGPTQLPVIISFRGVVCGMLYDVRKSCFSESDRADDIWNQLHLINKQ